MIRNEILDLAERAEAGEAKALREFKAWAVEVGYKVQRGGRIVHESRDFDPVAKGWKGLATAVRAGLVKLSQGAKPIVADEPAEASGGPTSRETVALFDGLAEPAEASGGPTSREIVALFDGLEEHFADSDEIRPTADQESLLRHFAGQPVGRGPAAKATIRPATYEVCQARGWLELREGSGYRTTDAGRAAIGLPPRSGESHPFAELKTVPPTHAQVALIRYFAGGPKPDVKVNHGTYRACKDRGWLEEIREFPYHRPTAAGREIAGLEPLPRPANGATYRERVEASGATMRNVHTGGLPGMHIAELRVPETGDLGGIGRLLCGVLAGGPLSRLALDRVDCLACVDTYTNVVLGRDPSLAPAGVGHWYADRSDVIWP